MENPIIEIMIPTLPDEQYLDRIVNCALETGFPFSIAIGTLPDNSLPERITWEKAQSILAYPPHLGAKATWFLTTKNRAHQLNVLIKNSRAAYFWFLHADSIIAKDAKNKALDFVKSKPESVGYGTLQYQKDGPSLCYLNSMGANLRSLFFKMPFEDQGLITPRKLVEDLCGFRENIRYGEGHDFIWRAKLGSTKIQAAGYKISTSARRYREQGWLQTTCRFAYLTWKQAAPYLWAKIAGQTKQTTGIAVFVKTQGLSPMKTRLARSIGKASAETFQTLAISHINNTLQKTRGISAHWAVSEGDARFFSQWKDFPVIYQGEGDLGEKIDHVYRQLLAKHEKVFIVGSDSPQMTSEDLAQASQQLQDNDFVLGKASDGGFWLFGGKKPVDLETWRSIPWSSPDTLVVLASRLQGKLAFVKTYTDVDEIGDFRECLAEFTGSNLTRNPVVSFMRDQLGEERANLKS